jgi:hypothetical protein
MPNERLTQWEDSRREYLSGAIALLFGLSSASLAFCSSLLTKNTIKLGGWRTGFFLSAVACFIFALLASLLVTFTRLQDARTTANIVRKEGESMTSGYIERLRSKAHLWGRLTWWLLYVQLAAFSAGALLLLVSLWLIFQSKLFP